MTDKNDRGSFFLHIGNIWKIFFVTFSALSPGSFLTLLPTLKIFYFRKMIVLCIHELARDDNIHQFAICSLVVNLDWLKVCRFNFKLCKKLSKKFGHFWERPVRLFQGDSGSNKCTANHGYTVDTFLNVPRMLNILCPCTLSWSTWRQTCSWAAEEINSIGVFKQHMLLW